MNITTKRIAYRMDGIFSDVTLDDTGAHIMYALEHAYRQPDGTFQPILQPGKYNCVRNLHTLENGAIISTFEVMGVVGHSGVLFPHVGNFDEDSKGCTLSGTKMTVGADPHQGGKMVEMVTGSNDAYEYFMSLMIGVETFTLTVVG